MKELDLKIVKQVRTLRDTLDKRGRKISLKKIKRLTGADMRQIKYILYERDNQRIKEWKEWRAEKSPNQIRESPLKSVEMSTYPKPNPI